MNCTHDELSGYCRACHGATWRDDELRNQCKDSLSALDYTPPAHSLVGKRVIVGRGPSTGRAWDGKVGTCPQAGAGLALVRIDHEGEWWMDLPAVQPVCPKGRHAMTDDNTFRDAGRNRCATCFPEAAEEAKRREGHVQIVTKVGTKVLVPALRDGTDSGSGSRSLRKRSRDVVRAQRREARGPAKTAAERAQAYRARRSLNQTAR